MNNKSKEFFLSLFDKTPELRVLVFHNGGEIFVDILNEYLQDVTPRVKEIKYNKESFEELKLRPRAYEYALLVDIFDGTNSHLIEEIYHSLENSANIVVLSTKTNQIDSYFLQELLDTSDFRAVNEIDIFDEYYLISGKKMHMWGSGL
ncbi:hypothetical protein [Arcobacter sp. FWKO B]|uniref:hypothetical protein n=1 Tax=Arcobacter sp. FWKO B TaxID=2593672 RepID=UPI0018A67D0C|nr:hypothetical protein [Arcobacter sp. FWKO B]QOG12318.1 hypothetical protein FWKOB_06235 [Arcobacter sp. FWKO B]